MLGDAVYSGQEALLSSLRWPSMVLGWRASACVISRWASETRSGSGETSSDRPFLCGYSCPSWPLHWSTRNDFLDLPICISQCSWRRAHLMFEDGFFLKSRENSQSSCLQLVACSGDEGFVFCPALLSALPWELLCKLLWFLFLGSSRRLPLRSFHIAQFMGWVLITSLSSVLSWSEDGES